MDLKLNDLRGIVKDLCNKDLKYKTLLYEIIEVDKLYENDSFGFSFKDVKGLSGGSLNVLLQNNILKYSYKSNSSTNFRLAVEGGGLKQVLDEVKEEKMETEQVVFKPILNPVLAERFEQLISEGKDMLEYWNKWINPKIENMEPVKKALLISMASHGDRFGDRGRVHVLMYGDPGSAKSQLMSWITYQIGAMFCSQRTSKVGLTGDGSGDEITPGALPRAHKGILCVDELDKFSSKDRQGLLEAMEEGKVRIDVGKFSVTLDAEARVIGAANKIDDFSPELLDRFDFKFELKAPVGETDKRVTCCIVDHWFEDKEGYDGFDLKNYLNWISGFQPSISKEVREKIKLLLCMYIDLDEGIRGSPRRKEGILRVAYTIAKLHRRSVEVKDVLTAIRLLNPGLNNGKIQALEQVAFQKGESNGTTI